ncbi:cytosine deaminase [Streptosporangium canum]|uniref:Cytosine deaminase n=1 Tax=Streptosporangium canum TaxID=324952 RepID=A0A1I4B9F5_9ACTN|nr:amidohydrolase [Streptosporangium canum]SFK64619.1 cytosine deaminase [Streptosporangium canum]
MTELLLLRDARIRGHEGAADLLIRDGRIAEIRQAGPDRAGDGAEDLGGRLVLPGLVDGHAHLDKTLWGGPWVPHDAAPGLMGKIRNGQERRPEFGVPNADFVTALLENMIACGTTHVRSHVDVDPLVGLGSVEAVREAVERHDGRISAELVAFPQAGMLISPGTEALLEEALKAGVESIGGLDPAGVDQDAVRHLDAVFALAERYGAGVDIHLHDGGTLGAWQFELIIERTKVLGLGGKVTVSHAFALADADPATRDRLISGLAEARIALATVAPNRGLLPLRLLGEAGVPVTLGNDGVRDLWSPFGTGDMLERALFQAKGTGPRDEDIELALDAATYGGARALGLRDYGLSVGDHADLVVVDARNAAEAVCVRPRRSLVVKSGRIVARDGVLA